MAQYYQGSAVVCWYGISTQIGIFTHLHLADSLCRSEQEFDGFTKR